MISKQLYLLVTAGLLLLSVGTGFAMQTHKSHRQAAIQSLQTASLQLDKMTTKSPEQTEAAILVKKAIQTLKGELGE